MRQLDDLTENRDIMDQFEHKSIQQKPTGSDKTKILIVDDESLNLNVLVELLRDEYKPVIAKNGLQALERVASSPPPELILLDIMMPEMDGYEVCRRLKASSTTAHIPVIFVTAMGAVADETRGFELGAVDYITKPISPALVRARVKTHLELSRARESLKKQNAVLRDRLNFLTTVIHAVSQSGEVDTVLQTLLDGAVTLVGAERGVVATRDLQGNLLSRMQSGRELGAVAPETFEIANGRNALIWNSESHSKLATPLSTGEELPGLLYLERAASSGVFDRQELDLVSALSDQTSSALRSGALERDRARLHQFLERYVSPQVAGALVDNADSPILAARETEVTILFADIVGFTGQAEQLPPSVILEFLNQHFSLLVDVIYQHEGMVKQFAGDEVMAIFGAPSDQPDHAQRAVRAGLAMLSEFERWQSERAAQGLFTVGLKIGLHRGPVVVGSLGSAERMEYAAVGDVVNTASRVMSLASHFGLRNCVLTTQEVVDECADLVTAKHLGDESVKGKQTKVSVYQISARS
jgi:class 3 adenylate cyclase/CheY-like chemotaxis protein